ncbi:hypothetical protein [Peredibacter starrii]|uniref:Uncharacterized protein n=1 Tax=Peredibacter starrii TaxID=28202 RepID=A0AAX4HP96_9BACT|nr:hypothetical protein [Peredibacter starrii]WPU65030.1 hypothetical protein SOO65_20245 [Peredibacter starrii]
MKISLFAMILTVFSISTHAKTYTCEDDVDSDIKILSYFNSKIPFFEYKTIHYNSDGSIKTVKQKTILSLSFACETEIDFKTDCSYSEIENSLGYSYRFACSKQKIKGSVYIDENGFVRVNCNNQEQPSMFCFQ